MHCSSSACSFMHVHGKTSGLCDLVGLCCQFGQMPLQTLGMCMRRERSLQEWCEGYRSTACYIVSAKRI